MKKLIIILAVLGCSVALGLTMARYPGYMLLSAGPYRLETTLWFGLLGIAALIFVIHLLFQIIQATLGLGERWRHWKQRRKRQRSHTMTIDGLCALAEGHWADAEKTLVKAAKYSDTPLMNHLAAAKAAQQQGALSQRDQYLKRAIESTPSAQKAVGLTQAELQLEAGQFEQALASLQALRQQYPKHKHVLLLLKETYELLGDWDQLVELLPALRQQKCLDKDALAALTTQALHEQWQATLQTQDTHAIQKAWDTLSKQEKQHIDNALAYIDFLLHTEDHGQAQNLLSKQLQRQWDSRYLARYAQLNATAAPNALTQAERWLEVHADDVALLDCLSRLCQTLQLWGKAKDYLAKSLAKHATPERHYEMAALHQQCHENNAMTQQILAGLALQMPVADSPHHDDPETSNACALHRD